MGAPPVVLAEVTRGPAVESVHVGHVAAVTGDGRLAFALGDPGHLTVLRSSAKPFQVLPVLTDGAADRFGFTDREVALACGSHEGEPVHQDTARRMLERAGLGPDALRCGIKPPFDETEAEALVREGREPTTLHNECSGEHAAMAALAHHLGAPLDTYVEPGHPVQRRVHEAVAQAAGVGPDALPTATDGCRLPTFVVGLDTAALMFARLVCPPDAWGEPMAAACGRVVRAMTTHPEMVDGTATDRLLDSALMKATGGRVVSKMGAEGVAAVGVRPSEAWPQGLGVAVKIADGDPDERARPPVLVAVLRRLGVLSDAEVDRLAAHRERAVTDNDGETVGAVRPAPALVADDVPVVLTSRPPPPTRP